MTRKRDRVEYIPASDREHAAAEIPASTGMKVASVAGVLALCTAIGGLWYEHFTSPEASRNVVYPTGAELNNDANDAAAVSSHDLPARSPSGVDLAYLLKIQ